MGILEAIIIGIVQGLTEFLPVSSSGHIELIKEIQNTKIDPDKNVLFTVILHGATALSTVVVFKKDILKILKGLVVFKANEEFYYSLKIVLSMLPAAIVGLTLEDELNKLFDRNLILVGTMLLITAALLFLADKAKKTEKKVTNPSALAIGLAQAIAIMPGISRSGATIGTSVMLGIDRTESAKFSFLMVVPLIFGKMAKDGIDVATGDVIFESSETLPFLLGFIAAFVTGILACKWMISLVKKAQLKYFSLYCACVGIVAFIYAVSV